MARFKGIEAACPCVIGRPSVSPLELDLKQAVNLGLLHGGEKVVQLVTRLTTGLDWRTDLVASRSSRGLLHGGERVVQLVTPLTTFLD